MSNLIEYVYKENDKINVKLAGTGDQVKVLTLDDVDSVVDLYRAVYAELQQAKCEKFIHQLEQEEVEELITSGSSAIIGYFKDGKHLAGALYTKPFEKDSKYFQTPAFEGDKTVYAIGGLAVDPKYRGNGVVSKIANVAFNGVRAYAQDNPDANIAGTGFEISCENFGSLMSLGGARNEHAEYLFNLLGIHYINDPEVEDNDLTVLGYASFDQQPQTPTYMPKVVLNGNQGESFEALDTAVQQMGTVQEGTTTVSIDGHNITTFNSYINAPIKEVVGFDSGYTATYPPQLEK